MQELLAQELGAAPDEVFAEFEQEPLAAASIAQAHGARLTSGEEVVVKVQRPGIGRVVERDLDIVLSLAGLVEVRALSLQPDRRPRGGRGLPGAGHARGDARTARARV
ncbi:MAG: AarF/UbiB family protein [Solirubrobacteraceae bacterium]